MPLVLPAAVIAWASLRTAGADSWTPCGPIRENRNGGAFAAARVRAAVARGPRPVDRIGFVAAAPTHRGGSPSPWMKKLSEPWVTWGPCRLPWTSLPGSI